MSDFVTRQSLEDYLNEALSVGSIQDYCPNGLQVEGKVVIEKLATAVTASQAAIDAAVAWGADALLVHHGFFWRNEPLPLTGVKGARIRAAMQANLNIFAYHLPLDIHPVWGNNAQLANLLNLQDDGSDPKRVWRTGTLDYPLPLEGFIDRLRRNLRREPLVLSGSAHEVKRVAWCTGAAQSYFLEAIQTGIDTFITGEVSESCYHLARETGVTFISAGHHATERYGVLALADHLVSTFGVEHQYIELPNPV